MQLKLFEARNKWKLLWNVLISEKGVTKIRGLEG
jgi:hypothetical protein